jgi:hypothetical protein
VARGELLMLPAEDENRSTTIRAWHAAFGGHHTLVALLSHVVPITLNILVWLLFARPLVPFACHFRDDARLLSLWPLNFVYLNQLVASRYSTAEICWLFAVTSTTSAIWLSWLFWRICFEAIRRDVVFVPGSTKFLLQRTAGAGLLFVLCLLICAPVSGEGFSSDFRLYGLSLKSSVGLNAFKIVFIMETFFFLSLGAAVEMASLFGRYLFLGIRHRYR